MTDAEPPPSPGLAALAEAANSPRPMPRFAFVDVVPELLPGFAACIGGYGLEIVGSGDADVWHTPVVRLKLMARNPDLLPAECAGGPSLVTFQLAHETYGEQRIVRVSGVIYIGPLEGPATAG